MLKGALAVCTLLKGKIISASIKIREMWKRASCSGKTTCSRITKTSCKELNSTVKACESRWLYGVLEQGLEAWSVNKEVKQRLGGVETQGDIRVPLEDIEAGIRKIQMVSGVFGLKDFDFCTLL